MKSRAAVFAIIALAIVGLLANAWLNRRADGCPVYTRVAGKVLVAHAGGGLPHRTYANSIEAMDLAYGHGLRLIELDFRDAGGTLRLGHDRPSPVTVAEVLSWLKRHPDALIVTDFKTDNVRGLTKLAAQAGPLRSRFIPQFYFPSEYRAVTRLGMRKPIFTMYRLKRPPVAFANAVDVQFVTMPVGEAAWAARIRKPVLLHTVNRPADYKVAGFYTDCLIPAPAPAAPR